MAAALSKSAAQAVAALSEPLTSDADTTEASPEQINAYVETMMDLLKSAPDDVEVATKTMSEPVASDIELPEAIPISLTEEREPEVIEEIKPLTTETWPVLTDTDIPKTSPEATSDMEAVDIIQESPDTIEAPNTTEVSSPELSAADIPEAEQTLNQPEEPQKKQSWLTRIFG